MGNLEENISHASFNVTNDLLQMDGCFIYNFDLKSPKIYVRWGIVYVDASETSYYFPKRQLPVQI